MNTILTIVRKLVGIRKVPKKGEGFEWIDGEDSDEDIEEPLPMFYVGDYVQLYNPYEGGFMSLEYDLLEPERREIVEVDYDNNEKVFRYRLADIYGEDTDDLWYSEEWLSLPSVTTFTSRRHTVSVSDIEINLEDQQTELEDAIVIKSLENELKEREIDRLLDVMNEGTAEERKVAEEELRKMTRGVAE